MKQYTLLEQTKTKDFPFSIDMLEHDCEVAVHTHDSAELVIILAGRAVHVVDGQEYGLKAGDVFVISTHSEHGYKNAQGLKLCNIMFELPEFAAAGSKLKQLPGFQSLFVLEPFFRREHRFGSKLELDPARLDFVKELLGLILREYEEREDGFRPVIGTYFTALITYLSRQYSAEKNNVSGKLYNLASAIAHMENNFLESLDIGSVASIACLSVRQFSRVFGRNYGMSPKEYLIKLRLDYACKLMRSSGLKLGAIAMESGFSDISLFSRQFKARYGISPREYRRALPQAW